MASKLAPTASNNLDELDNFFLDGDLDDDPFASPKGGKNDTNNKRKEPGDGLGIDEEISIAKKARVPRIKLDQDRLMSQKGIPALRRRAKDLKLKGKGHEWSDATRLLSFYQEWLDDLFPKAKFLDALAMVEKAGHNKVMHKARVDWINEGKPKDSVVEDGGDDAVGDETVERMDEAPRQASRIAPIFVRTAGTTSRPKTPEVDDLFGGEDDIYNATPIGVREKHTRAETAGEPDEDELDALMAEAQGTTRGPDNSSRSIGDTKGSIFGDGRPKPTVPVQDEDEDDLDALIAEAEAAQAPGKAKPLSRADKTMSSSDQKDDLDALIAEAEAQPTPSSRPPATAKIDNSSVRQSDPNYDDEEEAMAEMDGLW